MRFLAESLLTSFLNQLRRRHRDWVDSDDGKQPVTVHGFRSSFRTWSQTSVARMRRSRSCRCGTEFMARSVAIIGTGLVKERRALLDPWSRHLRGDREVAEVIQIRSTG